MVRLLVTGGEGFMGSHFVDLVTLDGRYEIRMFEGDICDKQDVIRNLRDIDTVVNFAALTYLPPSWTSPRAYMNVNYGGVLNLLNGNGMFKRFIQISTSHVYGNQVVMPIGLDHVPNPGDPYAIAKLAAENAVRAYADTFGFDYTIVRPFNNFGPRQSRHFVVPTFIRQALHEGRIVIHGDTQREFLYVKDNVRVIKGLLDTGFSGTILSCKGETYSISEVAQTILEACGRPNGKIEIRESNRKKNEIQRLLGDRTSLKLALPGHTWTPLPQAIGETVEYYRTIPA
ncbi:MAG TPA: GDP-mannose 4,6-dehydratase [Nitrososphaerales archaeon]|nr:GDP-mannose 4,6-dehydratase [Nitrososphaerales archaeon]